MVDGESNVYILRRDVISEIWELTFFRRAGAEHTSSELESLTVF